MSEMTSSVARIGRIRVKAPSRPFLTVVPFQHPASGNILDLLATMTEKAKAGELDGLAMAATRRDQGIVTCFHFGKLFPLVGAVVALDERLRREVAS